MLSPHNRSPTGNQVSVHPSLKPIDSQAIEGGKHGEVLRSSQDERAGRAVAAGQAHELPEWGRATDADLPVLGTGSIDPAVCSRNRGPHC